MEEVHKDADEREVELKGEEDESVSATRGRWRTKGWMRNATVTLASCIQIIIHLHTLLKPYHEPLLPNS